MRTDPVGSAWVLSISCLLLLGFTWGAAATPTSVTIAGSMQSEIGCPGDWQAECSAAHLSYDANDNIWQQTWSIPAGNYEYKATIDDSWDENYGLNAQRGGVNIPLNLAATTSVKFYYDHTTHWLTDNVNSLIVVAPGSFQSELGCPGDWDAGCLRSWLEDPDGNGIYEFLTSSVLAGSYEAKAVINEAWDVNYGLGGMAGGINILFTVPFDNAPMLFAFSAETHVLTITAVPGPNSVPEPGTLGLLGAAASVLAACRRRTNLEIHEHCSLRAPAPPHSDGPRQFNCASHSTRRWNCARDGARRRHRAAPHRRD